MHEYSLMQRIINAILARTSQEMSPVSVTAVVLEIGRLEIHSEEATRQAFTLLTQGTPLENSRLQLSIIPPTLECQACGHSGTYQEDPLPAHALLPGGPCPNCGGWAEISGGRGVGSIQLILAAGEQSD